jgi:hypothetical protein
VAGAIRRQATTLRLDPARRAGADTCATYLTYAADGISQVQMS